MLYTIASAQHPYERESFQIEPPETQEPEPSGKTREFCSDWDEYRAKYGETRVGEVAGDQKQRWEAMAKAMLAFKVSRSRSYGRMHTALTSQ